jgi:NADPH:quinone reductase-like Zn-dependent oxidoreductase
MKAVYFLGDRKLEVRDTPDPTSVPDEVILEIKASGMCGSNLKYTARRMALTRSGLARSPTSPPSLATNLAASWQRLGRASGALSPGSVLA